MSYVKEEHTSLIVFRGRAVSFYNVKLIFPFPFIIYGVMLAYNHYETLTSYLQLV